MTSEDLPSFGPRARVLYHPYEQAVKEERVPYARRSRYLAAVDQFRSAELRFRHCDRLPLTDEDSEAPQSLTRTTRTTASGSSAAAAAVVVGASDLTSPEKTLAFNVSARSLTVSKAYAEAFVAFEAEINLRFTCAHT